MTRFGRAFRAVLVMAGVFCAVQIAADNEEWDRLTRKLTTLLENAAADVDSPGLRAAVLMPDGQLIEAAVGVADKRLGTPMTTSIGMPGGSTGKTFVAAVAMLLVEDGLIALDDPVSKWLSDRAWFAKLPGGKKILVRHLLEHSSGLADHVDDPGFTAAAAWQRLTGRAVSFEPDELVRFVLDRGSAFEPGEGMTYTDTGYILLGLVIEAASGRSYYELLQERVLDPLALQDVRPAISRTMPDVANGYVTRNTTTTLAQIAGPTLRNGKMKIDPRTEWTGGGLITTPKMLVTFFKALNAGQVVRPETFATMLAGGYRDAGTPGYYGYGFYAFEQGGRTRAIWHGGWYPGYLSWVSVDRDSGLVIAAQANRDGELDLGAIASAIRSMVAVER